MCKSITVFMCIEGKDVEVSLPTKFEVCGTCEGTGTQVNPAIDGNGLNEELADDPDFMEDYMGGFYDTSCCECEGIRVVSVIDEDRCTPEQIQAYDDHMKDECEYRAIVAAERRMGC